MNPSFTREAFFQVFAGYNEAVWPVEVILVGLALVAVYRPGPPGPRVPGVLLVVPFLWSLLGLSAAPPFGV